MSEVLATQQGSTKAWWGGPPYSWWDRHWLWSQMRVPESLERDLCLSFEVPQGHCALLQILPTHPQPGPLARTQLSLSSLMCRLGCTRPRAWREAIRDGSRGCLQYRQPGCRRLGDMKTLQPQGQGLSSFQKLPELPEADGEM